MSVHTVKTIRDGDTFEVSPAWKRGSETGSWVRPAGFDAPALSADGGQAAKDWLTRLILHEEVDLGEALSFDRGRLVCDVLFKGRNLATLYRER